MALSKEANKLKYQYNRKYVERYWEKKAQQANGETVTTKRGTKKVSVSTDLLPDVEMEDISILRSNSSSDEKYIKSLEDANRTYRKENKRLVQLLKTYQEIIKLGLKAIEYEDEK